MSGLEKEYIAGLCVMGEHGSLDPPYDSTTIMASSEEEARRKAKVWGLTTSGGFTEHVWVQVMLDGRAVGSIPLVDAF